MTTQTTTNEPNGKVRDAIQAVGEIAEVGLDLGVLKKKIEIAVDDAVLDAERKLKRGKYAVEDAVVDTTHFIKKNPWPSVGYAAGTGFVVGLLIGMLATRPGKSR